jgi:hypothetical protein
MKQKIPTNMFNQHILQEKDLKDVKEIVSGYCFFSPTYVVFLKIKYNKWWKLPKTLKFYDYDEANRFIHAVQQFVNI